MASIDDEQIFLTVPNPVIIGPDPNTLDIPNVICENLTVTNSMTVDGLKFATDTIVAPAMTLSYMQAVSAAPANIPLGLLPKGSGGIIVDYPDNAATGGNLRGQRALDFQFQRAAATQVASGDDTLLAGTISCTASGLVAGVVSSQTSINGGNTSFVAATTGGSLLTSTNSVQIAATTPNMDTSTSCLFIGTSAGVITGATRSSIINSSASTLALTTGSTIVASASSTIASANNNFIAASTAGTINGAATFSVVAGSSTARVAGASNRAGVLFSLGSGGIDITGSTDAALIGTNTSTLTNSARAVVIGADTTTLNGVTRMGVVGAEGVNINTTCTDVFVGGCFAAIGTNLNATAAVGGYGSFTSTFACSMLSCDNGSITSANTASMITCTGTASITDVRVCTLVSCENTTLTGLGGVGVSASACLGGTMGTCARSAMAGAETCTMTSAQKCFIGGCTTAQIIGASQNCVAIASQGSINAGDTVAMLGSQGILATNCTRSVIGAWGGSIVGSTQSYVFGGGLAVTRSDAFIYSDGVNAPYDATNDNIFSVSTTGARAVEFYTNGAGTTGVFMNNGDSAWNAISDRKKKENIEEIRAADYLEKLEAIPIYTYNYIGAPKEKRCIGPMAQDWSPAFSPDPEALYINSGEVQGVLLAAIKALAARVRELEAKIK